METVPKSTKIGPFTALRETTLADLRACGLTAGTTHRVIRVIDGDTFVIDSGRDVRLVGLQAPKLPLGRKGFEPWPLGQASKQALSNLTLGRKIRLMYGGSREDRHGRILAHVLILSDDVQASKGIWLAKAMLVQGMARVYTFRDNRSCVPELLRSEGSARANDLGIWADAFYAVRGADHLRSEVDTFQLVEGRVVGASVRSDGVYLDFGEDWRTDFTGFIANRNLKRFEKEGLMPLDLAHSHVRLRGWLDYRNGPMMELTHPEQIEVLER